MIITIDTERETTPANYAREINQSTANVLNWIKRDQIKSRKIDELDLILVTRNSEADSIKEKRRRIIASFLADIPVMASTSDPDKVDPTEEAARLERNKRYKEAREIINKYNKDKQSVTPDEIDNAFKVLKELRS